MAPKQSSGWQMPGQMSAPAGEVHDEFEGVIVEEGLEAGDKRVAAEPEPPPDPTPAPEPEVVAEVESTPAPEVPADPPGPGSAPTDVETPAPIEAAEAGEEDPTELPVEEPTDAEVAAGDPELVEALEAGAQSDEAPQEAPAPTEDGESPSTADDGGTIEPTNEEVV